MDPAASDYASVCSNATLFPEAPPPEVEWPLDDFARLACQVCRAPTALICLTDKKFHQPVPATGTVAAQANGRLLPDPSPDEAEVTTEVITEVITIVRDTPEDTQFSASPLAAVPLGYRFCAAVPLITAGRLRIGTLYVLDTTPRDLDAGQVDALSILGRRIAGFLEPRHAEGDAMPLHERSPLGRVRAEHERARHTGERLAALLAVSNDLSKSSSLEALCRRAVELGRSRLGFDRLGIWFLTDQPGVARGSFGVDEFGELRDERDSLISTEFASEISEMLSLRKPYLLHVDGPVFGSLAEVVGSGSRAMAALWDGEKAIGYMSTDNLICRRPVSRGDCEMLSLYAAALGHLCRQVQTESELRASEERTRLAADGLQKEMRFVDAAIDSLPGIFYFLDREGRLLRWNRNCEVVSGYTNSEIAGMHPLDFFPDSDRDFMAELIQKVFDEGVATGEADLVSKGGTKTTYFFTGQRTILDGATYLVGTGIDISERKRLQEQLLQSQKMEGIGRLAGGVAHDFNNLLTAILGYVDLAKDELTQPHPAYPYLDNVGIAAERAAMLTSQLLAFARKQVVTPHTLSLNAIIVNTGDMLRRLIGEDIEVIILPGPDLWLVKADVGQLSQVLINLVVNARDAMPTGGKLTVKTANVTRGSAAMHGREDHTHGDYVMLAVQDTGVGMQPEIQKHMFEPFFTTKDVGKGTGLGLALCYGIVTQCGGHISVDSQAGHGTTFTIFLPRAEAVPTTPLHAVEDARECTGTETILLVEDEPLVLDFAARALRAAGYEVVEASNGHDALRIATDSGTPFHIVVTDVIMPRMGGKALADLLRQRFPAIRILFASGYTGNSVVDHGVMENDVAFLQKPYQAATLTRKVREVLDSN